MLRVCPKCHTASNQDSFCPNDGTRLVDPEKLRPPPKQLAHASDPLIGQMVAGRYRVLSQLGEGGMGNVYRAVQESIEKKVALKVLKAEYSASPDMVERFQREAVSACRIKHPNVVDVFDLGQVEDGRFYLAMELLEGRDLAQVLAATGPMPSARGVHLALQICRALNAAHQSGIVHRDLKPENIFLHRTSDGDEIVKIVDFGIAHILAHDTGSGPVAAVVQRRPEGDRKLTHVGTVFGTPEYMAPEQAQGMHIDHRADIYAIGVILYKMFTGYPPFTGSSFLEIIAKQVGEEPARMSKVNPDLQIPRELEQVILQALAKKPEDRFDNMARFAQAIAYASRDLRRARGGTVRAAFWGAFAVLMVALLGLGGWFLRHPLASRPPPLATPMITQAHASVVLPAPPPIALPAAGPSAVVEAPAPVSVLPELSPPASALLAPTSLAHKAKPVRPASNPSSPSATLTTPTQESPPPPNAGSDRSLPQLERCFETVEGVRRQVPCSQ